MIESVYSNEKAEANLAGKVQTSFKMPKNIRQIGKSNVSKKIYVEDYVVTFTRQLGGEDYSSCRVAVLVGQYANLETGKCILISGAVEVKNIDVTNDIIFTNDHWTDIYDSIKKYFVDSEIVGWFLGGPGYLLEDKQKILKAHLDNFAGQDKTLLIYDNVEKEEAFYLYENGDLCRQEGYYIYYEKNEEMQNYMIEHKQKPSEEAQYDDRVSREIRNVIQNKKVSTDENKSINRLMYAAGTLLAVIILIVGAAILNNYDQMKNMQDTLNALSQNLKEVESVFLNKEDSKTDNVLPAEQNIAKKDTKKDTDIISDTVSDTGSNTDSNTVTDTGGEESLNIEIVPGGIEPLKEDKEKEDEKKKDNNRESEKGEEDTNPDSKNNPKEEKKSEERVVSPTQVPAEKKTVKNSEIITEGGVKYYIVKAGDSLAGISYRLYNSANYISIIKELNNIEDEDMIYIGQKLIVP